MRNKIVIALGIVYVFLAGFFVLWALELGTLFAPTAGQREDFYLARGEAMLSTAVAFLGIGLLFILSCR